jgi:ParB/RepB/Spo0J family partition protein
MTRIIRVGYKARANLHPDPANRPDGSGYEGLEDLARTLKHLGCLQALQVRPYPGRPGHYIIKDGWRRWTASEGILDELPVQVIGELPVSARAAGPLIAVTTSAQKVPLGPVEMARALGDLLAEVGTQARICELTGMRPGTVSRHLLLLEASEATLEAVRTGKLGVGRVRQAIAEERGGRPGGKPGRRRRPPGHFNGTHPLAAAAAGRCEAAGHEAWTRLGGVACGPCFEAAIREDAVNAGGRPGVVRQMPRRSAAS